MIKPLAHPPGYLGVVMGGGGVGDGDREGRSGSARRGNPGDRWLDITSASPALNLAACLFVRPQVAVCMRGWSSLGGYRRDEAPALATLNVGAVAE